MRTLPGARIALLVASVLVLSQVRPAVAGTFAEERAAVDAGLAARLDALAEWSEASKLKASRDRALSILLRLRPDDGHARALLGYKRQGDAWVKKADWPTSRDATKGPVEEFTKRIDSALSAYRDDFLVLLDAAEPPIDAATREKALRELSSILPNDEVVREALGAAPRGDRLLSPDAVAAVLRRKELKALATAAKAAVADPAVEGPEGRFKGGAKTAHVRVRATTTAAEAVAVARQIDAALGFFESVLPRAAAAESEASSPSEVLLFSGIEEARPFFRDEPRLTEKRWREAANLRSFWIPESTTLLLYDDRPDRRALAAVRHTFDAGLAARLDAEPRGWVTEGLGQVLTHVLTGRRGIPFFELAETGESPAGSGLGPEASRDWLAAAASVWARPPGPDRPTLAAILTMRLTAMTTERSYVAYAFSQWLLEARADKASSFLLANRGADDADGPLRASFGMDAAALEVHLVRWIAEAR